MAAVERELSFTCNMCRLNTKSYREWMFHLTTDRHQLGIKETPGSGEVELLDPRIRDRVVIANHINNSTPLMDIAEHFSQWGRLMNFIHRTTERSLFDEVEAMIQCAIVYQDPDSVLDATRKENRWIMGQEVEVKMMFERETSTSYTSGSENCRNGTMPSDSDDSDSCSESESDSETTPEVPQVRPKTPDSGWELSNEEDDDSDYSSDIGTIRKGRIRMNQQLWKYFESTIATMDGCDQIFEIVVRRKFQTLWLLSVMEFTKKFFSQCCLLNFQWMSLSEEDGQLQKLLKDIQDTAKKIARKDLTVQESFDWLEFQVDLNSLEFRCETGDCVSGFLYAKKFWKKSYLEAVTLPLWSIISGRKLQSKPKSQKSETLKTFELTKPKTLTMFQEMQFRGRLDISLDLREEDIPSSGNIGASVNLTLQDDTCSYKGRSWRLKKLRFIVSLYEKLCHKYLNLRIKQWVSSCKDINYAEFDGKFKKKKKKDKGPPKWRKFRAKWKFMEAEREKYRKKIATNEDESGSTSTSKKQTAEIKQALNTRIIFPCSDTSDNENEIAPLGKKKKSRKAKIQDLMNDMISQIEDEGRQLESESEPTGLKRKKKSGKDEGVQINDVLKELYDLMDSLMDKVENQVLLTENLNSDLVVTNTENSENEPEDTQEVQENGAQVQMTQTEVGKSEAKIIESVPSVDKLDHELESESLEVEVDTNEESPVVQSQSKSFEVEVEEQIITSIGSNEIEDIITVSSSFTFEEISKDNPSNERSNGHGLAYNDTLENVVLESGNHGSDVVPVPTT